MRKVKELKFTNRNRIIKKVISSYDNFIQYKGLADKNYFYPNNIINCTNYKRITNQLKSILTFLGTDYIISIGNRKIELIMSDENNKIVLTKSFIRFNNKIETRQVVKYANIKKAADKIVLEKMYDITREYFELTNRLLEGLNIGAFLLMVIYTKDTITINVTRKYRENSSGVLDRVSGDLINTYAFDLTPLKKTNIKTKPDKVKEMIYLSLGIIIA